MKAGVEHRVPLSDRAAAILKEAGPRADGGLVFPSINGRALSDNTLSKLLRENDIPAVPHGFRSSFRDWASEKTNAPHAVMEAALAHTIPNQAERAYARSDLFDRRGSIMESWARYLSDQKASVTRIA